MWRYCFNFHALERKREYWSAFLINAGINLILWLFCFLSVWMLVLVLIYNALSIVPLVSMSVRRLHDADCSGFYLFMALIPIVGWVLVFVKLLNPSSYDINTKFSETETGKINKEKSKEQKGEEKIENLEESTGVETKEEFDGMEQTAEDGEIEEPILETDKPNETEENNANKLNGKTAKVNETEENLLRKSKTSSDGEIIIVHKNNKNN